MDPFLAGAQHPAFRVRRNKVRTSFLSYDLYDNGASFGNPTLYEDFPMAAALRADM